MEAASPASMAGRPAEAVGYARPALERAPTLAGWPLMRAGILLAGCGAYREDQEVTVRANREQDPFWPATAIRDDGPDTLYVPETIDVGSAVLAAAVLRDADRFGAALVDARLHPVFARAIPDLNLLGVGVRVRREAITRPVSLFAAMRSARPSTPADGEGAPLLASDPERAARLTDRYDARFGAGRRRVGLAWKTSNPRTGRERSPSLGAVRALCRRYPDVLFVSLHAHLRDAVRDVGIVASDSFVVDEAIDPVASIEDQLAQISALSEVVSIDCSAAHFAVRLVGRRR